MPGSANSPSLWGKEQIKMTSERKCYLNLFGLALLVFMSKKMRGLNCRVNQIQRFIKSEQEQMKFLRD